jgi:hypothetical protein
MNSQPSNKRKQQPSSFRANKQRFPIWFSKPSLFRFKLKSGCLSCSCFSSSARSSLSSDPSISRSQSPAPSTTSNDSDYASTIVSNQASVAIKKSSKVEQTLDAVPSKFEAHIRIHSSTSRPTHSTAPQTTPHFRQPISKKIAIHMLPGVCS